VSAALDARSFRHGVHPHDSKARTAHLVTERMPFVNEYVLPLSQHIGAPSRAAVTVGERVTRGQPVATPGGFVSTTLHSPVTGVVTALTDRRHPNGSFQQAIVIEADAYATQRVAARDGIDWRSLSARDFVSEVQRSGMVGLGGAAFPSHVKYSLPEGKRCHTLVINGCECEPFLTCDHRVMIERPEAVIRGAGIMATKLGAERVCIGVESNKPDAVVALRGAAENGRVTTLPIDVVPLRVKYPQGAEKLLIKAILDKEVPAGKLPLDVDVVVNNVGTAAAIADYFDRGLPLIERVVTVSGPGIAKPANVIVPIGTPVRAVLDFCGGLSPETRHVVMGGPMMGAPLGSVDVPVLKGTSGLLAFTAAESAAAVEHPCIRCGRCLEACPYFLNPQRLARLARARRYDDLDRYYLMDCMECGSCTFSCPSGIPIVQLIRTAKAAIRARKAAS